MKYYKKPRELFNGFRYYKVEGDHMWTLNHWNNRWRKLHDNYDILPKWEELEEITEEEAFLELL